MGATLDFVVSEQVSLTVEIPDCVCMTYDAAKFLIQTSQLNLGSTVKDGTVTDPERAFVYRQSPRFSAGGSMRVGEQVDLYLTQNRPSGCPNE
jgi:beta-lactam-binding protein with PASTA domain